MCKRSKIKQIMLAIRQCLQNKNIDLLPEKFAESFIALMTGYQQYAIRI